MNPFTFQNRHKAPGTLTKLGSMGCCREKKGEISSTEKFFCLSSVQSLSCVQLFATSRTTARQASLSITKSRSLLKLTSIELVMPPNHHILWVIQFSSVQLLSRVQLCNPTNRSMPGFPAHHQLPEFSQTHVHQVSEAIQPSHPMSSLSPPAPNPSQQQGLFQ